MANLDQRDTALAVVGEIEMRYADDARPVTATQGRWFPYLGSGDGRVESGPLRGRARFSTFESELGEGASATTCIANLAASCALNLAVTIDTDDGASINLEAIGYAVRVGGPVWRTSLGVIASSEDARYTTLLDQPIVWLGTFDEERRVGRATLYLADPGLAR